MKPGKLSLFFWALLTAGLTATAYSVGGGLAKRWAAPLPVGIPTPVPPETVQSTVEGLEAASALSPGAPAEGELGIQPAEWWFQAAAGQSATLEMWFHPGLGSNLEAEVALELTAADGAFLASGSGSVFLPPYVTAELPAAGLYRVLVRPTAGEVGRYSLLLTLSDGALSQTPSAPGLPVPPASRGQAALEGRFAWPTLRRDISGWTFHDPDNPNHIGLDIAASLRDPIMAVADGVVVFAEWGGGYGNLVVVQHDADWTSYYAHLDVIAVEVDQIVRQGELLGGAGSTGYSTGTHLHFELRYQGRPVDPLLYLP